MDVVWLDGSSQPNLAVYDFLSILLGVLVYPYPNAVSKGTQLAHNSLFRCMIRQFYQTIDWG